MGLKKNNSPLAKKDVPAVIRVVPSAQTVDLTDFKGEVTLDIDLHSPEGLVFSVDIYSFQPQNHPENHLGWWHFRLTNGIHRLSLKFDFSRIHDKSVRAFENGAELSSPNFWFNPDFLLDPLEEAKFVFWTPRDEIAHLRRLLIRIRENRVLKDFTIRHYRKDGWAPELPFLDLLHHYKLKLLRKYFGRYFKGRILDAGCGLSLFTEIKKRFSFAVIAGDIVFDRMRVQKKSYPEITWTVFDAALPPFKPESFDGLFAGEILEHLPRPESALREWNRALKKGGIIILTTPNRKRRVNVLNQEDWPFSPDHLREFSYEELNDVLLPAAGFRPLRRRAIYRETRVRSNRWWQDDYLQREGNRQENSLWMKILFRLGYLFPRRSLVLITVAKKIQAPRD